jgi:hypothetical protein
MNPRCKMFRSIAGLALAGAGLFLLFGRVMGAADRLNRTLDQTASARMEVVSWIMIAASIDMHRLEHALLTLLWPLLPGVLGTVLLWSVASRHNASGDDSRPCVWWA